MEELYKKCVNTVYGYMYSLCRNSDVASDLTQEVFLQAIESIDRYNGECKVSVWLCQIGKHLWYRYMEKTKRDIPIGEDIYELVDTKSAGSAEDVFFVQSEVCDVLAFISQLSEDTRSVMFLRLLYELSFREIGTILGRTENWARVTYYRGKVKVMDEWESRYGKQ